MTDDQNTASSQVPAESAPHGALVRWVLIVAASVVVFAIGGLGGYYVATSNGNGDLASRSSGEMYTCPMHPQVRQIGPGTCPICFMDLVPVGGASVVDTDHTDHDLKITPRDRIIADVATVEADYRMLTRAISAPVTIDFNEGTQRVVSARSGGRIERLFIRETGVRVRKGDPLMSMYSPELVAAQKEYLVARETALILSLPAGEYYRPDSAARAARGKGVIASSREKLLLLGMSTAQINALEQRGDVVQAVTIFSPISGIVLRRGVAEGAYVTEGTMLMEVVDNSTVWGMIDASQDVASQLRAGIQVTIRGTGLGERIVHGYVDYIYPTADAASRTIRLRAPIANTDGLLRPGMLLTADLLVPSVDVLAVPVSAVIRTGERDLVYVEVQKNMFEARQVRLGIRSGDFYQIVDGDLKRGERVVAEGGYLLDSERQLTESAEPAAHKH